MRASGLAVAGAAVAAVGLLAAGSFAIQAAQPRALVVVARQNLMTGQEVTAADLTVSAVPDGGGRGGQFLPASLIGLVPGEIVSQPVLAGGAVLVPDIHPRSAHYTSPPAPAGMSCIPSQLG